MKDEIVYVHNQLFKINTKMEMQKKAEACNGSELKPKRRRLRVGDPDFAPPDGGWGWMIVVACGFSNLSTFPMFQQFGLVFREKFEELNISNAQTTTVININSAFNTCVGLLNGPVFRKFTYRQVAFFGASLVAISLYITSFCSSFWSYLILYSMFYGTGIGITQSSNALALNTYFKQRRRIATGFSWSTTALGPILWPYVITFLMSLYGTEGTVLIFAAFAGHAIMCSLLLQPVHWHTKFRDVEASAPLIEVTKEKEEPKSGTHSKPRSIFSSQYLFNEDDPQKRGYEITDPGTPQMVSANDGWYSQPKSLRGSRVSLSSNKEKKATSRLASGQNSVVMSQRPSYNNLLEARSRKNSSANLAQDFKERKRERKLSQSKPAIQESVAEDCPSEKAPQDLKEEEKRLLDKKLLEPIPYPNEKDVLKTAAKKLEEYKHIKETEEQEEQKQKIMNGGGKSDPPKKKISFWRKVAIFFDFDLLKDKTYVNLMLGLTIANFVEINFSILTPFVLKEFDFEKYQVSTFMSLLGATDIVVRFFIPFVADRLGWQNKTFFMIGVLMMAAGRIILVHTRTYIPGLVVAMIIGFGKGLRTIFIALVIPTYVPLERLPAASGLQLASSGMCFLFFAPVIGWIRDAVDNYVVTLHILNILTYLTAISWMLEDFFSSRKKKTEDVANNT